MFDDRRDLGIAHLLCGSDRSEARRPMFAQRLAAQAVHPIGGCHFPTEQPELRLFGADQIVRVAEGCSGGFYLAVAEWAAHLFGPAQTGQRLARLFKKRLPFAPAFSGGDNLIPAELSVCNSKHGHKSFPMRPADLFIN
jgi:hypothetical protein